jgi:L-ascorbate metabolism protein UlaG (beta-lactamase superfamily)
MIRPLQKDESFLTDVRDALKSSRFRIWWLGQSGFLIANAGRLIVLDPYLSDSLTRKYAQTDKPHVRMTERVVDPAALGKLNCVDVVTSSHNHTDHLDAESLTPILSGSPAARLAIPEANRSFVLDRLGQGSEQRLIGLDAGQCVSLGPIEIHGIAAAHNEIERDEKGRCRFLGYLIVWDGRKIYHSGDTLMHAGLVPALRPFHVDLALLPINGNRPERRVAGNLNGREAARLATDIGARVTIPCHYDMFEFNTASPAEFEAECARLGQAHRILLNGEGLDL